MHIVLVHGFLNRGGILRRLAGFLEANGHRTYTPSLKPCDGRSGIPALAQQLKLFVEQNLSHETSVVLIGFSMGAIVSRYYLQNLQGHERAALFFSIAGPHEGTFSGYLYPGDGTRQLRYRSNFLTQLNASVDVLKRLTIVCYWTPYDLMIRPVASCRWNVGESVRIPSLLHSLLIFDRRLYRDIAERLRCAEPREPGVTTRDLVQID